MFDNRNKKENNYNFTIDCGIYPMEIHLFFSSKEYMFEKLSVIYDGKTLKSHKKFMKNKTSGAVHVYSRKNYSSVIHLFERPKNNFELSILIHEIFHATLKILKTIGIQLSVESEEAYAYFLDYLTFKIFEGLKLKISYED